MGKMGENTAMAVDKGQRRKVAEEARNNGTKAHVASYMDLRHLKNSELEPQYQKYKGSVIVPKMTL